MGLAGGIVRKVFSRSPCTSTSSSAGGSRGHHSEKVGSSADHHRRRWSSLRLYLCGEEMNAKAAAEEEEEDDDDDAETVVSAKSFETCRVTPPEEAHAAVVAVPVARRPVTMSDAHDDNPPGEPDEDGSRVGVVPAAEHPQSHGHVDVVPGREEGAAATLIQSAFRGFMARKELRTRQEPRSPTSASVATSVLVQVGESLSNLRLMSDDSASVQQQQRSSPNQRLSRTPPPPQQPPQPAAFRVKEEWDDSTVSSNVSRMRMQSRIEATTRRERALAYAFSQQLRSCGGGTSKKRSSAREEEQQLQQQGELNSVGWSWLERWMATRQAADDCMSRNAADTGSATATAGRRVVVVRRRNDLAAGEEKESCGSNDVVSVVSFDGSSSVSLGVGGAGARTAGGFSGYHNKPVGKSRLIKGGRSLPRRKQAAASDHRFQARSHKVSKKAHQRVEQPQAPHKDRLEAGGFDDDACHYHCQPPTDY